MLPPSPNPLLGTALHTVGAGSAALCYTPQKYLHRWSWQTYWLAQSVWCWLLLPWIAAWLLIPDLGGLLAQAPAGTMGKSFAFGALYGVGGIAFGVSIRYIGFSLTYAIAIGVSCVLGTLWDPVENGRLGELLTQRGANYVIGGVILGAIAMLYTGLAGLRKERELAAEGSRVEFRPRIGLPVCLLAGVLSAVYNKAILAGAPLVVLAGEQGGGQFSFLAQYLFANPGAFATSLAYVAWLANRDRSWGEFGRTADGRGLARNYLLSLATGVMWYAQFFFYGLGHDRMGVLGFSSWAIHMTILILLSCGFGVLIGEWKACSPKTKAMIALAILLLFAAVGLLTYGNQLAAPAAA
ncbi:MAG TPA: L-rhamnose/proton symporter RhaT [Lacunisphaera sp.]|nr:L-rhamnose/proton symporter RhaT [Lacunisphaera sp.]